MKKLTLKEVAELLIKITIAGDLGAGKSTVMTKLCDALGWNPDNCFSAGSRFSRATAQRLGFDVYDEYLDHIKNHPELDYLIERELLKVFLGDERVILDARMGPEAATTLQRYGIRNICRILLNVNPTEGAQRIYNARRPNESTIQSVDEQLKFNNTRARKDKRRMCELYKVRNFLARKYYDIVIDTNGKSEEEVFFELIEKFLIWATDYISLNNIGK